MGKWLARGIVFAALMVIVRLVQGALIDQVATQALLISVTLCSIFAILAFIWGLLDGRSDARHNPDPDRRDDLAMTWLLAGLIAGLLSGAVTWLISLAYKSLYVGGLMNELTTFAAFTALLMFLPAILGVAIGRWLADRSSAPITRHSHAYDDEYRDTAEYRDNNTARDTDVFSAVRDDSRAGDVDLVEYSGLVEYDEQPSRVAVAERDADTMVVEDQTVIEDRRRDS